jgi:hypothetical protein
MKCAEFRGAVEVPHPFLYVSSYATTCERPSGERRAGGAVLQDGGQLFGIVGGREASVAKADESERLVRREMGEGFAESKGEMV